jgi:hypothetical protein
MTDVIVRRLVAMSPLGTWHLQLVLKKKKGGGEHIEDQKNENDER